MKQIYVNYIANALQVKDWQVENCAVLFEEGCTIPFISRYRKERTGGLDDEQVAEIKHWTDTFTEMEKRKESILATIDSQDKLTPELRAAIEACVNANELEDLYLPYRPKRRTRATIAKEAGLEPLADKMYEVNVRNLDAEAAKYVGDKVADVEAALAGARDIIAERLSESAKVRETLRSIFRTRRIVSKVTKAGKENIESQKFKGYFDYAEPLSRIAAHRLLAILRGASEGWLNVKIDADAEKCGNKLYYDFCQERRYPSGPLAEQIRMAIDDSYKRLLEPSITNEIINEFKQKADQESVAVFGENLKQLLLAAPVGQKRTMAIDPGFRNGCKIVCLDEHGNLVHHEIVYPHPPQNEKIKAAQKTLEQVIAAGGTGELLKFDVSDHEASEKAVKDWQAAHPEEFIEVLVNNAGIRRDNLLLWMEQEDWYKVMKTNLDSFYNVTRPVLQPMVIHKRGRIINMASLSGQKGLPGQTNYSAAKGGIIAATKALSQEVAARKVTVNAVAPGFIRTDMVEGLDEAELKKTIPAKRFGEPEEVAELVAFLVSDKAAYINGQTISINGGLYE